LGEIKSAAKKEEVIPSHFEDENKLKEKRINEDYGERTARQHAAGIAIHREFNHLPVK
jgi:hypothetical protein